MATIRQHTITHSYDVELDDGKRYRVDHIIRNSFPRSQFDVERWNVVGGGNMRSHHCDENGATFKRVVAATKQLLAQNDEAK